MIHHVVIYLGVEGWIAYTPIDYPHLRYHGCWHNVEGVWVVTDGTCKYKTWQEAAEDVLERMLLWVNHAIHLPVFILGGNGLTDKMKKLLDAGWIEVIMEDMEDMEVRSGAEVKSALVGSGSNTSPGALPKGEG